MLGCAAIFTKLIKVMNIMFGIRSLKLAKMALVTSVAMCSMAAYGVMAGDMIYATPDLPNYPAPIMPPVMPVSYIQQAQVQNQAQYQAQGQTQYQAQGQGQSSGDFKVSVDISTTYNHYEVNDGTTTTKEDQILVELRPYLSFYSEQDGLEYGGSVFTTLQYEYGATPAYTLGRSEIELLIKKQGDFAFGVLGGYEEEYFYSSSANPAKAGKYKTIDVSAFAEKRFGQFGISLIGDYLKETYGSTPQVGGGTFDESNRDNDTYGARLRLNYHLDESIAIFTEGSYTVKKYATQQTPDRDETAYGIRLGTTYSFNANMAVEVAGSYSYHVIECGCTTQIWGGDAKFIANIGGGLSGTVYAEGEYATSTDPLLNAKSVKLGAELDYQIGDSIGLSTKAEYKLHLSGPLKGQQLSTAAKIDYAFTDYLDVFAGVEYGYYKGTGAGWASNYGATIGLSLHN